MWAGNYVPHINFSAITVFLYTSLLCISFFFFVKSGTFPAPLKKLCCVFFFLFAFLYCLLYLLSLPFRLLPLFTPCLPSLDYLFNKARHECTFKQGGSLHGISGNVVYSGCIRDDTSRNNGSVCSEIVDNGQGSVMRRSRINTSRQ